MKETGLSFTETGDWETVVEFGEKVYISARQTIEIMDLSEEEEQELRSSLQEFEGWRPKIQERNKNISNKTAKSASGDPPEKKEIEQSLEDAEESMTSGLDAVKDNNPKEVGSNWRKTTEHIAVAGSGQAQRAVNRAEEFIYKHLMTVVSPYYFDNTLLNATLSEKKTGEFMLEVNPNKDAFMEIFQDELVDIDDQSRWHIEHSDISTEDYQHTELSEDPTNIRSKDHKEEQIENNTEKESN